MNSFKKTIYLNIIRTGKTKTIAALLEAECRLLIKDTEYYIAAIQKYKLATKSVLEKRIITTLEKKILINKKQIKLLKFLQENIWILLPMKNK